MTKEELEQLFNESEKDFVIYRLPSDDHLTLQHPLNHTIQTLTPDQLPAPQAGFAFAPFNLKGEYPIYFMPEGEKVRIELDQLEVGEMADFDEHYLENMEQQDFHESLVEKGIRAIKEGEMSKVVLARRIDVPVDDTYSALDHYLQLCEKYPKNFTYYIKLKDNRWMGSSPELLLSGKEDKLETVSLAGTISKEENASFRDKEKQEQQIVSETIEEAFKAAGLTDIQKEGPFEITMGDIAHLKTRYEVHRSLDSSTSEAPGMGGKGARLRQGYVGLGPTETNDLAQLILSLHPTPAVSGSPKDKAIDFIIKNEGYDRRYYTGFLGPVSEDSFELYVNLRCMKLHPEFISIFVGGGITADSFPPSEWEETVLKAKTLLELKRKAM